MPASNSGQTTRMIQLSKSNTLGFDGLAQHAFINRLGMDSAAILYYE